MLMHTALSNNGSYEVVTYENRGREVVTPPNSPLRTLLYGAIIGLTTDFIERLKSLFKNEITYKIKSLLMRVVCFSKLIHCSLITLISMLHVILLNKIVEFENLNVMY